MPLHSPAVHLKAISGEKEAVQNLAPAQHTKEASLHIVVATITHNHAYPQAGRHLQYCEEPPYLLLARDKGAQLIRLEFGLNPVMIP